MTRLVLPGEATLVASWRALARTSPGAEVVESPDAVAAVFPAWAPLNNAIAGVPAADADATTAALARLEARYADAGIDEWAYWVPSTTDTLDDADAHAVESLTRDATTLVMRTDLGDDLRPREGAVRVSVATAALAGDEPVASDRLGEPEPTGDLGAWVMVRDGLAVAGLWTCLHEGDCGIYAMGTAPAWRRQGVAQALLEHALADARERGARTASLQSTPEGVPLYRSFGFEAVGRYEEWVSSSRSSQTRSSNGTPSTANPAG